jgi:hypothetical protein
VNPCQNVVTVWQAIKNGLQTLSSAFFYRLVMALLLQNTCDTAPLRLHIGELYDRYF